MSETIEQSESWNSARPLTIRGCDLCRRKPPAKDFSLRERHRRAAVSVMSSAAEGWESLPPVEKRPAYNCARRPRGEARSMCQVLPDHWFISAAKHRLPLALSKSGSPVSGWLRALGGRT